VKGCSAGPRTLHRSQAHEKRPYPPGEPGFYGHALTGHAILVNPQLDLAGYAICEEPRSDETSGGRCVPTAVIFGSDAVDELHASVTLSPSPT
jgi:hypothetical protein